MDCTQGAFGYEVTKGAVDGGLADGAEADEAREAGTAFEQDEEAAFAGASRDNAVHLSVAKALVGEAFRRAFLDAAAIGVNLPVSGDAPGVCLAGAVAGVAFGQHDDAVFKMAGRCVARKGAASLRIEVRAGRWRRRGLARGSQQGLGETVGHQEGRPLAALAALERRRAKRVHPAAT